MKVKGTNNIFAAGDVNSIRIEKTAQNAEIQAKIVVENILACNKNKELESYSSSVTPVVISLGKRFGIFVKKNFVLSGFFIGPLKNFVEWKEMTKLK